MYDVLAVNHGTGRISIMAENKTQRNAEAIENMAIMRRGLEEDFYVTVPTGTFKEGDQWDPLLFDET